MTVTVVLDKNATPNEIGFIPSFLDENDQRSAREQLDANYQHGGGFCPLEKYKRDGLTLLYPGDPPMKPLAMCLMRNEMVLIYQFGFVAIMQPGGEFVVARMD